MEVPFTGRPTGWLVIGRSAELPTAEVRPLRSSGDGLVAHRDVGGDLHLAEVPPTGQEAAR